jgi:serine protease Do
MSRTGIITLLIIVFIVALIGLWQKLPVRHQLNLAIAQTTQSTQSAPTDINNSRNNAIVQATKKVNQAVVSITVTQVRIVSAVPFNDPFFDQFFSDFFPRRQFREQVKGLGSGVIISSDGYLLTNGHVVENATKIKVTLPDSRQFDAEVVDIDHSQDIALLKIKEKGLPYAALGNSGDLMIGEWAIALGNPYGFLLEDTRPTVTVGVISAVNRTIKAGTEEGRIYKDMIQTDAAINRGNSGGPLVNADGEVVGINTFIFSQAGGSEGIGFAIPIDRVKNFIEEAKKFGASAKSEAKVDKIKTALGLIVTDINPSLARKYQLYNNTGVLVIEVEPNGISTTMGIEAGDVILSINGEAPANAADFAKLTAKPYRQLNILVDRAGERLRFFYRV